MEALTKGLLYFRRIDSYWSPSPEFLSDPAEVLGHYPLDIRPRLLDRHYARFDEAGLPLRTARDGLSEVYLIPTICGFALGHWSRYLEVGSDEHRRAFMAAADFLAHQLGRHRAGELLLLPLDRTGNVTANASLSAMSQGEAISVLCRAWKATGEPRYLDAATACLPSFQRDIDDKGVVHHIAGTGIPWYEEYPARPIGHVLNGMIYALIGLNDLAVSVADSAAEELLRQGCDSVEAALPQFDSGFWSRYWLPEPPQVPYLASVMYHGLHIAQLRIMNLLFGGERFRDFAVRFESYARSPRKRARAALETARSKLKRVRPPGGEG